MKTIRCRNQFKNKKNGRCGHVLVVLTDLQLDMLKVDPEKFMIVRCPACPQEQRWSKISSDGKNKLKFEVMDNPPDDLPDEPEYSEEIICKQIG